VRRAKSASVASTREAEFNFAESLVGAFIDGSLKLDRVYRGLSRGDRFEDQFIVAQSSSFRID
jgi:hypothetical protein